MGAVSIVCINLPPRQAGLVKMNLSIWPGSPAPGTGHSPRDGCSVSDIYIFHASDAANYVRSLGMSGNSGKDLC